MSSTISGAEEALINPVSIAKPKPKKLLGFIDDRFVAPILITLILWFAHTTSGVLEDPRKTGIAILASICMELFLGRLFTKKWPHLASAYISGISIGILIRSPDVWPYALASMISITSKYVIRVNGRHLWNPSNLAICAMLVIAYGRVATLGNQFDNRIWAALIIWALGSIIIYRLNRFHICLTFAASFVGFAFLRALMNHGSQPILNAFNGEVAPITGPMYQLFIFFMITDPKTTVHSKKGQMVVAFLVAAAEHFLRLAHNTHAPYYALTIMGPSANLYEIWRDSRAKRIKS